MKIQNPKPSFHIMEAKVKKRMKSSLPFKIQNLLIITFLAFIVLSFNQVKAACPTEGLVPCGTSDCPCQFCHLFVLFKNIVDFLLFKIIPPLATLMIAVGGFMYIFASFSPGQALPGGGKGGPALLSQAKKIITSVIFGLLIIFSAWVVVNTFFQLIGVSTWEGWSLKEGWWQIKCQIK